MNQAGLPLQDCSWFQSNLTLSSATWIGSQEQAEGREATVVALRLWSIEAGSDTRGNANGQSSSFSKSNSPTEASLQASSRPSA
jgi:hypothetical protein